MQNDRKLIVGIIIEIVILILIVVIYANFRTDTKENINQPVSFEADNWETIANNTDSTVYQIGDTKCIALDGFINTNNNGCSNGEFLVRIANKSTPAECSGTDFSETACGFVVEFVDIITTHNMNSSNKKVGSWPTSDINNGSWPKSEMYTYLNDTKRGATSIYNALPSNLRKKIINTKSVTGHGSGVGESENYSSKSDKLYLLSPVEVYGADGVIKTFDSAYTKSRQLDYYLNQGVTISNYAGAIKQYQGNDFMWWLRTPDAYNSYDFWYVRMNGAWIYGYAYEDRGVSPAFRVG